MADVSVRPARPADAAEIARIQRDTLAMAYEAVMPPEVMAQLVDPAVREAILTAISAQISSPAPGVRVHVAMEGDQLVGFAFARPAVLDGDNALEDGEPDSAATGYLEQILVEPRWGRRGHGSRLLAATAEFLTDAGFVRAITWVPDRNAATVTFLESAGWARDGFARGLDTGTGATLREIRMHTAL